MIVESLLEESRRLRFFPASGHSGEAGIVVCDIDSVSLRSQVIVDDI